MLLAMGSHGRLKMRMISLHQFLGIIVFCLLPTGIHALTLQRNSYGGILAPDSREKTCIDRSGLASQDPTKTAFYAAGS